MPLETISSTVDTYFSLAPLALLVLAIGLVMNLVAGKELGEKFSGFVATLACTLAFVVAVMLFFSLQRFPEPVVLVLADWIKIGSVSVAWAMRLDTLSITMMLVVTGVGALIHLYAVGYMHHDVRHQGDVGRYPRFFVYFNLFIMMMLILVTADNYLVMFVGWEGVGLCSYLLIGFWFEKGEGGTGNARAGKKAFIVNRIGDFGLLLAMFMLLLYCGTLDFGAVFTKAPEVFKGAESAIQVITLLMLLGVTGKSAQIPLFVWLPDAMAGPTPVSALIHAATMVTAGVYLIARSAPLFELAPFSQSVVMWVGAGTALFAATIAVGQFDIKKVLAYSTISQLGFMVAAVGMGAYVAAIFHLITHAFFKALLFLSAGSVILGMEQDAGHGHGKHQLDVQDMRNMGGLRQRMPVTFWVYLIGGLTLAGIAPLAGFFSKDEILAAASHQVGILLVLILAAFLTAFYMGRQLMMVFFGKARTEAAQKAEENSPIIVVPLLVLALLSIVGGVLNLPGLHWLETWLEHTFAHVAPGEFVISIALLSLGVALLGLFLAWLVYNRHITASSKSGKIPAADADILSDYLGSLFTALRNRWWIDELYGKLFVQPYQKLATFLASVVENEVVDGLVNGVGKAAVYAGDVMRSIQDGFIRTYALSILIGVVAILTYLAYRFMVSAW